MTLPVEACLIPRYVRKRVRARTMVSKTLVLGLPGPGAASAGDGAAARAEVEAPTFEGPGREGAGVWWGMVEGAGVTLVAGVPRGRTPPGLLRLLKLSLRCSLTVEVERTECRELANTVKRTGGEESGRGGGKADRADET